MNFKLNEYNSEIIEAHMDVGRGRTGGTCPHFSNAQVKCPYLCNLVPLFESFENEKITRKMLFPVILEDLSFKISPRNMPPDLPVGLHCLPPRLSA